MLTIQEQLDAIINAGRGEAMFVERTFSVDYDARTVLSYDEDAGEWIVNQFTVEGDVVNLAAMPLMSFPGDAL